MYTIEDINKAKQYLSEQGYGTGSNFTLNTVANLMAEWAAKNCSIPAVINCDTCKHQDVKKSVSICFHCEDYSNHESKGGIVL
ncbi:MAG: hypothetical protein PHG67_09860 [Bacteroidales bacterium]|nr:hypothetical protein [Bacteroidales bacterium]MDD4374210.1 hypothetical protein [Bacteroidales bacterium]